MEELAKKLSRDIPFVRIDFYEIKGRIYFGEITFFPASGLNGFEPSEVDEQIGKMLILPTKKGVVWNE